MTVLRLTTLGALAFLQSCAPLMGLHFHSPEVAAGTLDDRDFSHNDAKSAKLSAALLDRFPLGSPESALRSEILAEGFALICPVGPYRRRMSSGGVEVCEAEGDWTR